MGPYKFELRDVVCLVGSMLAKNVVTGRGTVEDITGSTYHIYFISDGATRRMVLEAEMRKLDEGAAREWKAAAE